MEVGNSLRALKAQMDSRTMWRQTLKQMWEATLSTITSWTHLSIQTWMITVESTKTRQVCSTHKSLKAWWCSSTLMTRLPVGSSRWETSTITHCQASHRHTPRWWIRWARVVSMCAWGITLTSRCPFMSPLLVLLREEAVSSLYSRRPEQSEGRTSWWLLRTQKLCCWTKETKASRERAISRNDQEVISWVRSTLCTC